MEGVCFCTVLLKYVIPAIVTGFVIGLTYFLNKIGFFYVLTHKVKLQFFYYCVNLQKVFHCLVLFQVDIKSPRHGGELVAEVLKVII